MTGSTITTVVLSVLMMLPGISWSENHASYKRCQTCHSDIFELWKSSRHATSYSNPSFQAAYLTLMLDRGEETGQLCLRCHAPIAHRQQDFDFSSPAAAEGVSCRFCHAIASVKAGQNIESYYESDTSGVIYGPYEATDDRGHPSELSAIHVTAELCVGCHQYSNEHGVPVLETFDEWRASPYSRDEVYCQNCHMPIMVELSVVDDQETPGYYVTAHEFRGGHSQVNLTHAVTLETDVTRDGDRLNVKVKVTNAESGHKLPTGIPIRKLVLEVTLKSKINEVISSARVVYRKVLTDKYGTIIENAPDMFLNATSIYTDNRINPKETRVEEFVFVVPEGTTNFKVETVLNYEYTRPLLKEELVRIQMARNSITSRQIK